MGYKAHKKIKVWSEGFTASTGVTYKYGKAGYLNNLDTETYYCNARPAWRKAYAPHTGHHWATQTGWSYKIGASVLGVGVGTETDYTTVTVLHYLAGTSNQREHWTWGNKGNPENGGKGINAKYGAWPEIVHTLDWKPSTEGTLCGYS